MNVTRRDTVRGLGQLWLASMLAPLAGCGSGGSSGGTSGANPNSNLPSAVQAALARGTAPSPSLVTANNQMGMALYDQLASATPTVNVFISPTSLAIALSMLYNGAAGSTQSGMATAMQLTDSSAGDLNGANAALQASLVNPDARVQLTIANSLWSHSSLPLKAAFVSANQSYYGAQLGDLSGAPANIDSWVSSQTNGMITQIAPNIDYSTIVAMIVNAIYFKGAWMSAFDPSATQPAPFTRAHGSTVTVQMMSQVGQYACTHTGNLTVIRIPYGSGRIGMLAVLPDVGTSLASILPQITAANLATWRAALQNTQVTLSLPRFTSDYGAKLNAELTALGMGVAFDPNDANFSGLASGGPFYIAFVEHKTAIIVDEQGTTASGATGIGVGTAAGFPTTPVTFNRPFFYALEDDKTGALLFLGQMMDPTASGS